jgi:phage N-6-adenine-methyltransferase
MLTKFRSKNHLQQVKARGADDSVDDRRTSMSLYLSLHARFVFTLDVAASEENHLCERFFSLQENGLKQSWAGERVWCNPPFSDLAPWISKAWESFRNGTDLIVMLCPANRTEQPFWQKMVEPFRDRKQGLNVEFLSGRTRFRTAQSGLRYLGRPPFACCLLIWNGVDREP